MTVTDFHNGSAAAMQQTSESGKNCFITKSRKSSLIQKHNDSHYSEPTRTPLSGSYNLDLVW